MKALKILILMVIILSCKTVMSQSNEGDPITNPRFLKNAEKEKADSISRNNEGNEQPKQDWLKMLDDKTVHSFKIYQPNGKLLYEGEIISNDKYQLKIYTEEGILFEEKEITEKEVKKLVNNLRNKK